MDAINEIKNKRVTHVLLKKRREMLIIEIEIEIIPVSWLLEDTWRWTCLVTQWALTKLLRDPHQEDPHANSGNWIHTLEVESTHY